VVRATNLGYPRIGPRRELKRALEAHWSGELDAAGLEEAAARVEAANLEEQRAAGLDVVPVGDFSLYDHVLDTVALVGAVPSRFRWDPQEGRVGLATYFAMARGIQGAGLDAPALEMTKWFDTNYHYLVPEFHSGQRFVLGSDRPVQALARARQAGVRARVVLLGPVSFLLLGKARSDGLTPWRDLLGPVLEVYREVLRRLAAAGAEWVQLDEPTLVCDRSPEELAAVRDAYRALAQVQGDTRLAVVTYFGHVGEAWSTLAGLPVQALGLDFVRGRDQLAVLQRSGWPRDKELIAGVVDGRNVWITDLRDRLALLRQLAELVGPERLQVAPSCSLLHVPYDVALEEHLDPEVRSWLAFARQKLGEVVTLTRALNAGEAAVREALDANAEALERRRRSPRLHDPAVAARLERLGPQDYRRRSPYAERWAVQQARLHLPLLPTTTIGSFPQTAQVRRLRQRWRSGQLSQAAYETALEAEVARTIRLQEDLGLDVLVHGEFERSDMVEYFGEQLQGFVFTEHGWVQSYGSRCVKPPILVGTVRRTGPMTVRWATFAQSCTSKPVKGMLTGPVTMLQWSFVRDDQPRSQTCREIALALREEVADLEAAGIRVIQVDEPALREGLPLRREAWGEYLEWATASFRLATAAAADQTQVHTHMCYGEFGDILDAIADLDADVISMESARSGGELLRLFARYGYGRAIGPGVYDIHSPRVPPVEEMAELIREAVRVFGPQAVWVNPDCGLKTRGWPETEAALRNMVRAAHLVRAELGAGG
jgi:5-methyltetrahydropteroyltriglutamate--homocysteine methyltransferase